MTPLHVAAAYGHVEAAEHMVGHGANLFALDNYGQTAAKVAAYYQKAECCRYLDTLAVRWEMENRDFVEKMKFKAVKELKKRSKQTSGDHKEGKAGPAKPKKLSYDFSTAPSGMSPVTADVPKQRSVSVAYPPGGRKKKLSTQEALRQNFELRPTHSSEHIRENGESKKNADETDQSNFPHSAGSTFRPVPRVNTGPLLNTLQSLSQRMQASSESGLVSQGRSWSTSSSETSLHGGSAGVSRRSSAGKSPTELEPLPSHPMEIQNDSPLATFLSSLDLLDSVQLLHREKLDLEALALCDEKDLISIGLPLGPRKKILHAIQRRKEVITHSGRLSDSEL